MNTEKQDIYSTITNQIVEAIEQGIGKEKISLPWHRIDNENPTPRNVVTRQYYRGINTLILWCIAEKQKYTSGIWGTFKQWEKLGASIKKGAKGATIVFTESGEKEMKDGDLKPERYFITKGYKVFNIAQVENYNPKFDFIASDVKTIDEVDHFFNVLNPTIEYSGDRACYDYSDDLIYLPKVEHFKSTFGYYATLSHEVVHWTAHKTRLDRNLKSRFGSEDYAMEELIAELGAAFLCSELQITNEPKNDHANYINSWLKVLKRDKRAIFTASAKAQQAVEWMKEMQQEIA